MSLHKKSIYLLIISNLCFGILPILVKVANGFHYSAMEETFFRFVFGLLGVLILWFVGWQSLSLVNVQVLLWRGLFGGLSITGYFMAIQATSAAKGTLLNYTYILWANIFAVLFFKQKTSKWFFPCLLLAAAGVELVLDARWASLSLGDWAGLFSGITGGAAVFAVKRARYTDTSLSVFASFAVFSFFISGGLLLWGHPIGGASDNLNAWTTPDARGILILSAIGAVSMAAQVLFTEAIGKISLALGTLITLSVPVLAALFGSLFLGEILTPHFGLGMFLVLIACGLMVWQENKS